MGEHETVLLCLYISCPQEMEREKEPWQSCIRLAWTCSESYSSICVSQELWNEKMVALLSSSPSPPAPPAASSPSQLQNEAATVEEAATRLPNEEFHLVKCL